MLFLQRHLTESEFSRVRDQRPLRHTPGSDFNVSEFIRVKSSPPQKGSVLKLCIHADFYDVSDPTASSRGTCLLPQKNTVISEYQEVCRQHMHLHALLSKRSHKSDRDNATPAKAHSGVLNCIKSACTNIARILCKDRNLSI